MEAEPVPAEPEAAPEVEAFPEAAEEPEAWPVVDEEPVFDFALEDEPESAAPAPEPTAPQAEAEPAPVEEDFSISTEPVFDVTDMEAMAQSAEEDVVEAEEGGSGSPFEIFTKEPKAEMPPPEARAEPEKEEEPFEQVFEAGDIGGEREEYADAVPLGEGELADELEDEIPAVDIAAEMEPEITPQAAPPPQGGGSGGSFDTETLAGLYVRQGFYDKAVEVYRRMLRDRPEDVSLRQRLEEALSLQRMAPATAAAPALTPTEKPAPAAEAPEAAFTGEDPVIVELRRFLAQLKERRK
jgi:pentatricopeptide repeat protein